MNRFFSWFGPFSWINGPIEWTIQLSISTLYSSLYFLVSHCSIQFSAVWILVAVNYFCKKVHLRCLTGPNCASENSSSWIIVSISFWVIVICVMSFSAEGQVNSLQTHLVYFTLTSYSVWNASAMFLGFTTY